VVGLGVGGGWGGSRGGGERRWEKGGGGGGGGGGGERGNTLTNARGDISSPRRAQPVTGGAPARETTRAPGHQSAPSTPKPYGCPVGCMTIVIFTMCLEDSRQELSISTLNI